MLVALLGDRCCITGLSVVEDFWGCGAVVAIADLTYCI